MTSLLSFSSIRNTSQRLEERREKFKWERRSKVLIRIKTQNKKHTQARKGRKRESLTVRDKVRKQRLQDRKGDMKGSSQGKEGRSLLIALPHNVIMS